MGSDPGEPVWQQEPPSGRRVGTQQPTCLNWPGPPGQQVTRARAPPGVQFPCLLWGGTGLARVRGPLPQPVLYPASQEPLQQRSRIPAPGTLPIPPAQASIPGPPARGPDLPCPLSRLLCPRLSQFQLLASSLHADLPPSSPRHSIPPDVYTMSHHLLTAFPDLPPFGPGPSLTPHLGLSHSACPSSAPQPRTCGPQVSSKPSARLGLATGPLTKPRRGRGSGSRRGGQEAAWKTGQPTQKPCRKPPSHLRTPPPAPPPAACVT